MILAIHGSRAKFTLNFLCHFDSIPERYIRLRKTFKTQRISGQRSISSNPQDFNIPQIHNGDKSLKKSENFHFLVKSSSPKTLSLQKSVELYANAGDLHKAQNLFDEIHEPRIRSWTSLISGYNKWGLAKKATELYHQFKKAKKLEPNTFFLLAIARACSYLKDLNLAHEIHNDVKRLGLERDLLMGNVLIDMYGKCRFVWGATEVFKGLEERDVISWTTMASAYLHCGLSKKALEIVREMQINGVKPNSVTVSLVLKACSDLKALNLGREFHGYVLRMGLEANVYVSSGLVDVYANCLDSVRARLVFDRIQERDVVSWNVILTTYFRSGVSGKAFELFREMKASGIKPNLDSWNAMIAGCSQNGEYEKAMEFFAHMTNTGFKPNKITVTSLLPVCANLESLCQGRQIHGFGFRHGHVHEMAVATAIVIMYAKCGRLSSSKKVFESMGEKDTVAWNSMIMGHAMYGHGMEALALFNQMRDMGLKPNNVTFTGVLSACSHGGLVSEGCALFRDMGPCHGINPDREHYACMVDILSRSGRLVEAYELIKTMPFEPSAGAWGALLGACRVYKNVELGQIAASNLFEIEQNNPGNYILLSNIFTASGMWVEASRIRGLMREKGVLKTPGRSWVEIKNRVHSFTVGDRKHEEKEKIYAFLAKLYEKMKLHGYMPSSEFVLQDVEREEGEESLGWHSEKLAVAFGLLKGEPGLPVRVFKNLRICGDCHGAIKLICKIVGRDIIVRDSVRFHHFRDGSCSCRDFW
ncbi:pentatricopeptide repeat-containing protein At4g14050, mitochondrial [Amborella trichopoda]|uniref:pentatricopeptide repeat-containing protein At4g14050, mitochondrial n=1 Tax=Amborella trichopoda TaxID=13333 RepID=UPI0005D2DDE3|nr:pentatricopeptide repeat-containing protein At4g14050, mitochondrial [Amborella trichopoda]|eukprot:XP_011627772.1 pentatricopeptide repeat-containing protein At4g14050, mitochondrial [Amborella trichopoda]